MSPMDLIKRMLCADVYMITHSHGDGYHTHRILREAIWG